MSHAREGHFIFFSTFNMTSIILKPLNAASFTQGPQP